MQITVFELKLRLADLAAFRKLVAATPDYAGKVPSEDRAQINKAVPRIAEILSDAGHYPLLIIREAPVSGGRLFPPVDALDGLFTTNYFCEFRERVIDCIDKATGSYELDLPASKVRTYNPIWWLWRAVSWASSLPFRLIGWAGFDADAAESSGVGKVVKIILAIAGIASFLAALFAILDSPTFWKLVGLAAEQGG